VNLIESIVDGFILTVGITPPTPARRRIAVIFIGTALLGTVAGLVTIVTVVVPRLFAH
jgi:hypothetical protein